MKSLAFVVTAVAAFASFLLLPASAEDVNTTVSPKLIAITALPATLHYGAVLANTTAVPSPGFFTVTNVGSVPVKLNIRGFNTTTTGGEQVWQLAGTQGPNQYTHGFSLSSGLSPLSLLGTTSQQLHANVAPNGNINVYLQIGMPTEVTHYNQHSAVVRVTAVDID